MRILGGPASAPSPVLPEEKSPAMTVGSHDDEVVATSDTTRLTSTSSSVARSQVPIGGNGVSLVFDVTLESIDLLDSCARTIHLSHSVRGSPNLHLIEPSLLISSQANRSQAGFALSVARTSGRRKAENVEVQRRIRQKRSESFNGRQLLDIVRSGFSARTPVQHLKFWMKTLARFSTATFRSSDPNPSDLQ